MGGFGSGRKSGKDCADDMRQIDIRWLEREGYLKAGMAYCLQWTRRGEVMASINLEVEADRVWLTRRQRERDGQWWFIRYPVNLNWTACHLGGERVWWHCPAAGCAQRVAVLFGGDVFACRRCHHLAYRSQREIAEDRTARRAETLRHKLKWKTGILNSEGLKPRGMHWQTFERLKAKHDTFAELSLSGMVRRLGLPRLVC